jgi:hypothetical protein
MSYVVDQLAIHLVDRKKSKSARCSRAAQDVKTLPVEAINFLKAHIEEICTCAEGTKTRPAQFIEGSQVRDWYEQLIRNPENFLEASQSLARRLFDVSPKTASPGLLMVMLFRPKASSKKFLGMFKLDPSDEHLVRLDSSAKDQFAIDVEEIMQALPKAESDRVLKCAVVGHPTREDCDLKFRDNQSTYDPAQYFRDFLGCQIRPSERTQVRGVFHSIDSYAAENNLVPDWLQRAPVFMDALARQPEPITFETLVETARSAAIFPGCSESDLREILGAEIEPEEVYLSQGSLALSKMAYHLPGGIVIRGPIAAMDALVSVSPLNGGFDFHITTAGQFKIIYEL